MFLPSSLDASCAFDERSTRAHQMRMELAGLITKILLRARWRQEDLAAHLGVDQATVSRWLHKTNPSKPNSGHEKGILALASQYGITYDSIVTTIPLAVSIVGRVGIGGSVYLINGSEAPLGKAEMPPEVINGNIVSIIVEGDSMLPLAHDGWLVYFDYSKKLPPQDILNVPYIICLQNGQTLMRFIEPGRISGKWDLTLPTASPMRDQDILWAAPALWIRPQ